MPDFIEALELHKSHILFGSACIEDSGAEKIPQLGGGEMMKSRGGRTKVGGWGMFKKEGSRPGSISGGEGQEWETASETSSKRG